MTVRVQFDDGLVTALLRKNHNRWEANTWRKKALADRLQPPFPFWLPLAVMNEADG